MLSALLPAFLAIAAGVSVVIQQALNANLRSALHSAAWSGFISYAVGLACMALLVLALRDPVPAASVAARIPLVGMERRGLRRYFHRPRYLSDAADRARDILGAGSLPGKCSPRSPSIISGGWA